MEKEYNLSNPSVAEEERMIQDRINFEFDYRKRAEEAYLKEMEEYYNEQFIEENEREYEEYIREVQEEQMRIIREGLY